MNALRIAHMNASTLEEGGRETSSGPARLGDAADEKCTKACACRCYNRVQHSRRCLDSECWIGGRRSSTGRRRLFVWLYINNLYISGV